MALYHRTEGFVFKKEDMFEADRMFSVFTRDFGRIEVLGKAIRKIASKLRGGIEIFSFSEIGFIEGRSKKTLTNTLITEKFKAVTDTPQKFKIANKIASVLDNFIKGQEQDEKIWNLINDVFNKINSPKIAVNQDLIYYYFFWNLISILGYEPELSNCAICRNELTRYSLYFSNKEGGVICQNCSILKKDSLKIESDTVKILRLILRENWSILSKLRMEIGFKNSLEKISEDYYSYLIAGQFH